MQINEGVEFLISKNSKLEIGNNVLINKECFIKPMSFIKIGNNVLIQDYVEIRGNVIIGNDVIIARGVFIESNNHIFNKEKNLTIREQDLKYGKSIKFKQTIIEDDVWLGRNVVVLPGVTIKKESIIGANAVVTKSTEPYCIYGGVPARKIRNRYE